MPDGTTRFKARGKDIFHFVSPAGLPCALLIVPILTDVGMGLAGIDGNVDVFSVYGRFGILGRSN